MSSTEHPDSPDQLTQRRRFGRIDRRRFLQTGASTGIAAGVAGVGVAAAAAQDATPAPGTPAMENMDNMEPGKPTNTGFAFFVPFQAAIIQAAAARLIPTDENGPGATEAGVVYFIDRQLTREHMGFRGKFYQQGPYATGEATQGEQSAMPVRDRFRVGIFGLQTYAMQTFQKNFVDCTAEEQDQLLSDLASGKPENFGGTAMQTAPLGTAPTMSAENNPAPNAGATIGATAFFTMLLNWTKAGFFADPVQGGNRDMVGWKLIGFPGAHLSWADQIENYNQPFKGDYISLGQYQEQVGGQI